MKKDIHPQYYENAKVICACGNTWEVGSTQKEIHIEICSACHPFYTGKQKLIDTARRVEKFQERMAKKTEAAKTRKGKKAKRAMRDSKRKSIAEKKDEEIKKLSHPVPLRGTTRRTAGDLPKRENKETKGTSEKTPKKQSEKKDKSPATRLELADKSSSNSGEK